MEPRWLIFVCTAATHLILLLILLPKYWRSVESGWRSLMLPVFVPMSFATVLAVQLLDHWRHLPSGFLVLGSLGIGAATATVVVSLSRLRRLGA